MDSLQPERFDLLYYLYDGLGSASQLVNGDGEVWNKFMYEPFGEPKAAGKVLLNRHKEELLHVPFGFTGEAHDFYNGLIYLRARYYDPATARMLTEDTHWNVNNMIYGDNGNNGNNGIPSIKAIRQSTNLYTYALNNPTMYVDPSGEKVYILGKEMVAQLGIRINVAEGIIWDDNGNIGIIDSGSFGGGWFNASVGGFLALIDAENIEDCNGVSYEIGGSAGIAIPVLPIVSVSLS